MIDILISQLLDPFRIGLVVALVATMRRTAEVSGTIIPLAAGVLFVAVIIPVTMQGGFDATLVGVGLIANLVILAAILAVWTAFRRLRG